MPTRILLALALLAPTTAARADEAPAEPADERPLERVFDELSVEARSDRRVGVADSAGEHRTQGIDDRGTTPHDLADELGPDL